LTLPTAPILPAAVTLETSVIVLPMRSPCVVAKQAATLALMSNGRLILGIGVGSYGDEYTNVHADFHTRGARLDESICSATCGRVHPVGDLRVSAWRNACRERTVSMVAGLLSGRA